MDTEPTEERVVVPLAEEHVSVHKTARVTSGVRVRKTVQETFQDIDETVNTQNVTVERVPIGQWIDQPLPERQEGDTTIIPIIEEVAVIETRLRLVEEIRVTRTNATRHLRTAVPIRREQVVVEDVTADGDTSPTTARLSDDRKPTGEHITDRRPTLPYPTSRSTSMTTIIGLFTDTKGVSQARKAIQDMKDKTAKLQTFGKDADGSADDLRDTLSGLEIEDKDLDALTGALGRGALIMTVSVSSDRADAIAQLMTKHGAQGTDIHEDTGEVTTEILPEVEETMGVAKRATTTGIRAHTTVTERPVQQTVTLKEETVEARHRDANRELSPDEADAAFQDRTVEVTGVSEEAEIRKAARLIGEVEITKTSEERKETVRDTVRKTEVETERTGSRGEKRKG